MSETAVQPPPPIEVTEADFERDVLARSASLPVVVDFWAPWCAPCRALTPALEAEIDALGGRVLLAKVNVDENPGLANEYRIAGIPAVRAFRDRRLVAEFDGARDIEFVRRWLEALVPSEAQEAVARARELVLRGHAAEAAPLLAGIDPRSPEAIDLPAIETAIALAQRSPAAARGDWEAALEELFTVVAEERGEPREAALAEMRAVFDLLGADSDLARDFRRRLQIVT